MRKPTVSALKAANPDSHYFDAGTLRFFGQKARDFTISFDRERDCWCSSAPMYAGQSGHRVGTSIHYWAKDTLNSLGNSVGFAAPKMALDETLNLRPQFRCADCHGLGHVAYGGTEATCAQCNGTGVQP